MSSDFASKNYQILGRTSALPELIRKDCYYGFFLYVLEYFVIMEWADFPPWRMLSVQSCAIVFFFFSFQNSFFFQIKCLRILCNSQSWLVSFKVWNSFEMHIEKIHGKNTWIGKNTWNQGCWNSGQSLMRLTTLSGNVSVAVVTLRPNYVQHDRSHVLHVILNCDSNQPWQVVTDKPLLVYFWFVLYFFLCCVLCPHLNVIGLLYIVAY